MEPLAPEKFPAFCGLLVGLYASIQFPLRLFFHFVVNLKRKKTLCSKPTFCIALSRPIAAFCSAWLSLQFLNRSQRIRISPPPSNLQRGTCTGYKIEDTNSRQSEEKFSRQAPLHSAGKTMDLTLFALTRSVETIVGDLWSRHKASRIARAKWTSLEAMISRFADSFLFAVSSGMVMWAWFYFPDSLPRAYNRWIRGVAQVDRRLVEVLRRARKGDFVYGRDTGQAPLLESMCREYNWPLAWGDPAQTVPIPCEMVHSGFGPSCHWHAAMQFFRAFKIALATSLPLQILLKARKLSWQAFERAFRDAFRSAAFLGTFVGLFYYGVCLSRTCLGPKIFRSGRITPMMWDQGLCIRAGCVLCGWSILIEAAKRRQEVASFVAPKAVATILPRRYGKKVNYFHNS